MPNEAKIKSEAFSGRQHVKWVNVMSGVGARALFASFWPGMCAAYHTYAELLQCSKKGLISCLWWISADINGYRRYWNMKKGPDPDMGC